jgi:hypothetical protein
MTDHSFEFTRAITRRPARSVVDGLRAEDHGTPDFDQMLKDHAHYVATLRETGVEIIRRRRCSLSQKLCNPNAPGCSVPHGRGRDDGTCYSRAI